MLISFNLTAQGLPDLPGSVCSAGTLLLTGRGMVGDQLGPLSRDPIPHVLLLIKKGWQISSSLTAVFGMINGCGTRLSRLLKMNRRLSGCYGFNGRNRYELITCLSVGREG